LANESYIDARIDKTRYSTCSWVSDLVFSWSGLRGHGGQGASHTQDYSTCTAQCHESFLGTKGSDDGHTRVVIWPTEYSVCYSRISRGVALDVVHGKMSLAVACESRRLTASHAAFDLVKTSINVQQRLSRVRYKSLQGTVSRRQNRTRIEMMQKAFYRP